MSPEGESDTDWSEKKEEDDDQKEKGEGKELEERGGPAPLPSQDWVISSQSSDTMIRSALIALLLSVVLVLSEKTGAKTESAALEQETIARVQGQLLNAMAMLESLEEPVPEEGAIGGSPMKREEKRRNKFEFIRFGRK